MTPLQFLHILNPNQAHLNSVRNIFKKNPTWPHVWVDRKSHPTHVETIVEWALTQGLDRFAIWGGDGTFSRSLQALYQLNKLGGSQVALIPVGTGNDFARKLGFQSWPKHVRGLLNSSTMIEEMDLGLLTTEQGRRVFVNNAGFGRALAAVKGKISNPIEDIYSFEERRMEIQWETPTSRNVETVRALMGIVFNGPYFNKGMFFDESISPRDGTLNAILIPPQNRGTLLLRFFLSRMGFSLASKSDINLEGQSIKMESEKEFFPQLDGEPATKTGVHTLKFEAMKGAFRLIVPREEK